MLQRCIVIGASAGGFEVVVDIASRLPADLPAPVFVVMHVPAYQPSYLPFILNRSGKLHAIHPSDGKKIESGFIYVAPPDHHLLIDDGHVAVKRGPKENGFRPSIDALFRSAAYSYGSAVIGVVLSGALHDGTSGLWTIKRLGGIAVVQDPFDAEYASMPRSALEYVDADHTVKAAEVSGLLVQLANEPAERETIARDEGEKELDDRIATEVQIAAGTNVSQEKILGLGELVPYTCPECSGSLIRIKEGNLSRFRCHTGHGYTEDALLEGIMQSTGESIWKVTRGLQETVMLLDHMGKHIRDSVDPARAEKFFAKARELEKRASRFQELSKENESMSENKLETPDEEK
jgi:two-component system chemotaxis response regulator CheB